MLQGGLAMEMSYADTPSNGKGASTSKDCGSHATMPKQQKNREELDSKKQSAEL